MLPHVTMHAKIVIYSYIVHKLPLLYSSIKDLYSKSDLFYFNLNILEIKYLPHCIYLINILQLITTRSRPTNSLSWSKRFG